MTDEEVTYQRMLHTAADLLRRQGYHGTALNQILRRSEVPEDSLNRHFPRGKEQLAAEAVVEAGAQMQAMLLDLVKSSPTPEAALDAVFDNLVTTLKSSEWVLGSPVATLALEMAPYSEEIHQSCAESYRGWEFVITELLGRFEVPETRRDDLAMHILASIEGALLLARTHRTTEPLKAVQSLIHELIKAVRN